MHSGWRYGTSLQGWALVERAAQSGAREQGEAGLVQLREGLAAYGAIEAELCVPLFLAAVGPGLWARRPGGRGAEVLAEALAVVEKNEERWYEAELYRLKGELTLQQDREQATGERQESPSPDP